ncbi:2-amino-4-hydroxy-6-hydroxymethyldihydropteridine diphosphokinase [Pengzhenrongella phosphoraccumulans]|uniref:2-amino-4-hydroxy-6- hydroxymethyldihydropteridine diphosphokinase n=1 Tax=Pengzhenrongella phosphoraccumulans TaxID=3114394 RepID=UPI00388E3ABD
MITQPNGVGPALDDSGRPYDQISLVGITATGYHGVYEHERREGQTFRADVVVYLDTRRAAATDDLTLTMDYGVLATQVAAVLAGEPANLIETVAERIAATALAYQAVAVVDVALHKPQAPVTVPFDDIVVTIRRDHHKLPAAEPWMPPEDEAPLPESSSFGSRSFESTPFESTPFESTPFESTATGSTGSVGAIASGAAQVTESVPDAAGAALAVEAFAAAVAAAVPPIAESTPAEPTPAEPTPAEPELPEPDLVEQTVVQAPIDDDQLEVSRHEQHRHDQERLERDRLERDRLEQAPPEAVDVVLALGSNVGPSQDILRAAIVALAEVDGLDVDAVSPLARTAPVGGPDQADFLNAVVLARTTLAPRALLRAIHAVEDAHGRQRDEHWGPRTLDVDLIVYGTTLAVTEDLELPHPRAHERAFVLQPWAQIAPDAVLPGLGGGPVAALAATAPDRDGIRWLALDWWATPHAVGDQAEPEPEVPEPVLLSPPTPPPGLAQPAATSGAHALPPVFWVPEHPTPASAPVRDPLPDDRRP